jgi:hypothetical protein
MILNTEKIKVRLTLARDYIAVYGTQDNPFSSNYDFMDEQEAAELSLELERAGDVIRKIRDELDSLRVQITGQTRHFGNRE